MIIGISLNEVIRDFVGQFAYTYSKYVEEIDLNETPITNWDLLDFFKFKSMAELNTFLHTDAALEIFGHADQLHDNVITKLNTFITNILDEEEHDVVVVSREADKSIPATLFFLSKLGFSGHNLRFVMDYTKKWDDVDVLITANPITLKNKPEGKISVKIKSTYNADVESDYEYDSILDLFNNEEEFINKIEQ